MGIIFTNFDECMDDIYRSYMHVKYAVEGKMDKEVRDPKIIISIASELNILPPKHKTIKITGSKGKGTVSRIINHLLVKNILDKKIGLLVSPEEFDHNDRMKIDNNEISKQEFIRIYNELKPTLIKYEKSFNETEYLSPSGLFLLIALYWFSENNVEHYILELGRGAAYDEVGQIPSSVSIITSILNEHASYLGATLKDIALNKFYVKDNSDALILGPSSSEINNKYNITDKQEIINIDDDITDISKPHWYLLDEKIAYEAVVQYCKQNSLDCKEKISDTVSASFGICKINETQVIYEPLVSKESIDENFVDSLVKSSKELIVIASLPDDKDIKEIIDFFNAKNINIKLITLSGTRGYLHYTTSNKEYSDIIINEMHYSDTQSMINTIDENISETSTLYLLGTHTYIRLVKISLKLMASQVKENP